LEVNEERIDEVAVRVRAFITDELLFEDIEVADDTPLLDDLIDSAGLMELVTFLEQEFELSIDPTEIDQPNFETVGAIAAWVEGLLEEKPSATR
jgi:acyl carrier protein